MHHFPTLIYVFFPFFNIYMIFLLLMEGNKTKAKLLVLFSNRTGGKGHNWKYREFHLNMSKDLYFWDEKRLSEKLWPSLENLETCLHVVPGNLLHRGMLNLIVPALAVLWLFNHLGQCKVPLVKDFLFTVWNCLFVLCWLRNWLNGLCSSVFLVTEGRLSSQKFSRFFVHVFQSCMFSWPSASSHWPICRLKKENYK